MELTEFLLARIAERERWLELPEFFEEDSARGPGWGNRGECPICGAYQFSGTESVTKDAWWEHAEEVHQRTFVLAECEAKRRIVELCRDYLTRGTPEYGTDEGVSETVLRTLALPYADREDYQQDWKP